MSDNTSQHWATVFGLGTIAGVGTWMYFGSPPTWAIVACFFTAAFFIFPARMKQWFKTLGDLAQNIKDSLPIGGS